MAPPHSAPLSTAQVVLFLESTCALLEGEITALAEAEANWHPAPGEWCANEVLGHLIEAERRGFAGRIRDILAGKALHAWDQAAVARERRDCDRVAMSLWMEFMGLRHDSVALVRGLAAADLEKSGEHPEVGTLRVRDLLHEWIHHDRNHTKQLLARLEARDRAHAVAIGLRNSLID